MTKLKQAQEALKTVSDKKEQLILKYKGFIANQKWHIRVNEPTGIELEKCNDRIDIYKDVINDLKFL